jgi:RNA polymerase primary sigma factor
MRQFKIDESRKTVRSDNFQRYTVDVNRYTVLTPDEEVEVARRARVGDPRAIETLVQANLRFVISVAKAYAGGSGDKLNDLINEGNLGLVEAAHDFDPSTGFKFISYAVWHVRKNMLKYLTNNSRTVRLPQNRVQALQKMKGIENELACELGRDPQDWEIFARYEEIEILEGRISSPLKPEQIESLKAAGRADVRVSSLDGPSTDDPDDQFGPINVINGDPLGTDWDVTHNSATQFLARQISRLSPIEKDIVVSYHGIGRTAETFTSLAERWGYSTESVRQKYKKALKKMQAGVRRSGMQLDEVI